MNLPKIFTQLSIIAVLITFFSGCATIFLPKNQKVIVKTQTPGASIIYAGDTLGKDRVTIRKVNKNKAFQQVIVSKDGYKSRRYCFEAKPLCPGAMISVLDIPFFPVFILEQIMGHKTRKYKTVQHVPALTALESRSPDEKYLYVNNTAVDAKGADIEFVSYNHLKAYQRSATRRKTKEKPQTAKDDLMIENTIFSDELNWGLKKINFIDTTNTIFPNTNNSLYVNATIKKITFSVIGKLYSSYSHFRQSKNENAVLGLKMTIEWDVLDYYKQKICTIVTESNSDPTLMVTDHGDIAEAYARAIRSAMAGNLEYALMDVRKQLGEKGLLKMVASTGDTLSYLNIKKPAAIGGQRINDFLKSTVSVKVDDGHGSGVILSSDGIIVTNYHVVAGTKAIEVIFNDGTKATGEVVRKNPDADLALIKVKRDSLAPLIFSDQKDPEIGIDVWAIGTPKSLELGQSVSRGIISGVRNANNMTYLQTDVKISPGNSGGALVNKDGTVMGIVSSKLIGFGTEGVGFAILSKDVFSKLRLKYNN